MCACLFTVHAATPALDMAVFDGEGAVCGLPIGVLIEIACGFVRATLGAASVATVVSMFQIGMDSS